MDEGVIQLELAEDDQLLIRYPRSRYHKEAIQKIMHEIRRQYEEGPIIFVPNDLDVTVLRKPAGPDPILDAGSP